MQPYWLSLKARTLGGLYNACDGIAWSQPCANMRCTEYRKALQMAYIVLYLLQDSSSSSYQTACDFFAREISHDEIRLSEALSPDTLTKIKI